MAKLRSTLVLGKRLHSGTTAPRQYLTGIDILHGHVGVPLIFVYKKGFDIAHAERALTETLRHYPQVSGRYRTDEAGQVYNDGQDAGIDFKVYRRPGAMPYGEHQPLGDELSQFHDRILPWRVVGKDEPLLRVYIHQYEDGGIVMCVLIVHSTFDGSSFFGFMVNWSRTCMGQPIAPFSFDRDVMIKAGQTGMDTTGFDLVYQPTIPEYVSTMARLGWRAVTDIKKEIFLIPTQAVQRWKDQAEAELGAEAGAVNTGKLVSAYVLQTLSPLMPHGVPRSVGMALDMRFIKGLPLPRNYFGNGLCYAQACYSEQQLASQSLARLALQCKPDADQISALTLSKLLTVTEQYRQNKAIWKLIFKPAIATLGGGIVQNNLSLLPIYDVDLGGGTPDWYETFAMTIRMMALVSTPQKDGGVHLHMAASRAELKALRERLVADGITPMRPDVPA
jgi:shikimate O-hydroxycinnamoyltransferase